MTRLLLTLLALSALLGCRPPAAEEARMPVGSLAELMSSVVLPTSNAVLYVSSQTPTSTIEWNEFLGKTLMLAESAHMLNEFPYRRESELWKEDTQLLIDAAMTALESARSQDVDALVDLNGPLYDACIKCHEDFEVVYETL